MREIVKLDRLKITVHCFAFCCFFLGCSSSKNVKSIDPTEDCLLIAQEYFSRSRLTVTGIKDDLCYLEIQDDSHISNTVETSRLVGPRVAKVDLKKKKFFMIPRR